MKTIIVLGCDRVGKTTFVGKKTNFFRNMGKDVLVTHHGPIKPDHTEPLQQFKTTIAQIGQRDKLPDILLMDRYLPDTLFYESRRYNTKYLIGLEYVRDVERSLAKLSTGMEVVVIEKDWGAEMVHRHTLELKSKYPDCTDFWLDLQLQNLRSTHIAYYQFIRKYFYQLNLSITPPDRIHFIGGES